MSRNSELIVGATVLLAGLGLGAYYARSVRQDEKNQREARERVMRENTARAQIERDAAIARFNQLKKVDESMGHIMAQSFDVAGFNSIGKR